MSRHLSPVFDLVVIGDGCAEKKRRSENGTNAAMHKHFSRQTEVPEAQRNSVGGWNSE